MRPTAILILFLPLLLAACGGEPADTPPSAEPSDPAAAWSATFAFEAGVKLGGCAVGDVDPLHEGNEIAAVAVDGRVFLIHHDGKEWQHAEIARVPGEMIQCAIGDADPRAPGNELVVAGMAAGTEDDGGEGAAYCIRRSDGAWRTETIAKDSALIHGVCVGDLDTRFHGGEVATVGFSKQVRVFHREASGWVMVWKHELPAPGKTVVAMDTWAVVANTGPEVVSYAYGRVSLGPDGPSTGTVLKGRHGTTGVAQARIATDGKRVLVACDDGSLRLLDGGNVTVLHSEEQKLRGAVLADIDPLVPGIEAATAGYGGEVTLLFAPAASETTWKAVTVARDTDKFHHLAAGELLEDGLGLELVAVGYSGCVVVASRRRR